MQYIVSDYLATGEGMTICILITMAYPDYNDYDRTNDKNGVNEDGTFHFEMPPLKEGITPELIALRQFKDEFGEFYAMGARVISKEEFVEKWSKRVPQGVLNMVEEGGMGNLYYASKLHVNYS